MDAGLQLRHRPPRGRILVDTGLTELHDAVADMVQRQELEDARTEEDYTIREWVDAPGVTYLPIDGDAELVPSVRLLAAPGHTRGSQIVVVDSGRQPIVLAGDTAVWFGELDDSATEGQRLIRALDPRQVWLAHSAAHWQPGPGD
jgi:N-acyl homoserine lactone hydrolase